MSRVQGQRMAQEMDQGAILKDTLLSRVTYLSFFFCKKILLSPLVGCLSIKGSITKIYKKIMFI